MAGVIVPSSFEMDVGFEDYGMIITDALCYLVIKGLMLQIINQYLTMFRGLIKQSSKTNKAIIDQEEWINELKRFDFDRIHSTTNLPIGGTIISHNKNYLATLRDDGNFVIYVSSHFVPSNIVWQTNTAGKGHAPYRFTAQADGNIVLYDSKDHALWSSGSAGKGNAPYTLLLSDEGNLEWYGAMGKLQWESGSTRH